MFNKEDIVHVGEFNYMFDESIKLEDDKDAIKRLIYDEIVEFNIEFNGLFGDAKMTDKVIEIKKN